MSIGNRSLKSVLENKSEHLQIKWSKDLWRRNNKSAVYWSRRIMSSSRTTKSGKCHRKENLKCCLRDMVLLYVRNVRNRNNCLLIACITLFPCVLLMPSIHNLHIPNFEVYSFLFTEIIKCVPLVDGTGEAASSAGRRDLVERPWRRHGSRHLDDLGGP